MTSLTPPRQRTPQLGRAAPVLAVLSLLFVVFAVPPYLGLDPSQARLPVPAHLPWFYPMLVAHIAFGSLALLTAGLQLWPWLRRHHPTVHRRVGRIYLAGGVLPAGVATLTIAPFSSFGPVVGTANTLLVVLWLATAIAGYRVARQRRFAQHREWMIRNVALTFSIVANRAWVALCFAAFTPELFVGEEVDPARMAQAIGVATWLSWVVNLLVVEWWLQRTRSRTGGTAARIRTRSPA